MIWKLFTEAAWEFPKRLKDVFYCLIGPYLCSLAAGASQAFPLAAW
jgi:hypothetical protein